jgi:TorA maturation chaperone TorD
MSPHDHGQFSPLADAGRRSGVYHLLARLWIQELDTELLEALRNGGLGRAYHAAGGIPPATPDASQTLDDLQIDYCRLFIGPQGHHPPVQSIWQEGRFEGNAAVALGRIVDGLDIDTPCDASLPHDHIGNILALIGSLLMAVDTRPECRDADLQDLFVELFFEHAAWIPEFARSSSPRCDTEFYRGLMSVTDRFLTQETTLFPTAQPSA